ncbi:MAG: plasmid stabilization protein [Lentisphaerae bacterium RIFOXYB12_FULL_65_16]|nr:MAG: plasmid stabilization protein [Lentisphaerae bacterium RIFOXYA12_64_32]OGV93912.1 MAG: plasmid stabilization protein [Lentisphaerae bacterium RIFOXYB12_FULL_65_16]
MQYRVLMTQGAEDDLVALWSHLAADKSLSDADYVLGKIKAAIESLGRSPARGHVPPELDRIAVHDYLQIHFKPYRVVYQIRDRAVYVYCVLDGRRDLQVLLRQRLLR